MPDFTWMAQEERLGAAALTVRAQAVDPTDDGRLLWDIFMPRRNVDQTKLSSLTSRNVRITADRREWNARGRFINLVTPPRREIEWIPIEAYFRLEEKEINDLMNEVRGNLDLFRREIRVRIPERTVDVALANWRRLELDVFEAWALGRITAMNPQTGMTYVTQYGFDAGRYQTAATAWNDAGVNAFEEFLAFMRDAFETMGPLEGAMMRLATRNAIVADAPPTIPGSTIQPTVGDVERLIQDQLGMPFRFMVNEQTVDVHTDGGIARTTQKVWPALRVAAIPAGRRIGNTAFAPVVRAYDISNQTPNAGVDVRGVTIYHEPENNGRGLIVEGQFNPMPDPDEGRIFVINAGV